MVGSSSAGDGEFKLLDRRMETVTEIKRSNEVDAITIAKTVILLGFTLRIHCGEKVDSAWKQMKCLFGSDELKPQKPLLLIQSLQFVK